MVMAHFKESGSRLPCCISCPIDSRGMVIVTVANIRIALNGEQLTRPSIFIELALRRPLALHKANEMLYIIMTRSTLHLGDMHTRGAIPVWRRRVGRGFIHARPILCISSFSYGKYRCMMFVSETAVSSTSVRYRGILHLSSGLGGRTSSTFGEDATRRCIQTPSGQSSSSTIPICSVAVRNDTPEGAEVTSITCMTRVLCAITNLGGVLHSCRRWR